MKRIRIFASLSCVLACGPPTLATEGSDESTPEETGRGDTTGPGETAGEDETTSDDTTDEGPKDCPEQPRVISCFPGFEPDCPEGFKCGGYSGEDCVFGNGFGDFACVPVLGDQGPGQPCTKIYDQPNQYFTWHLDDCDASSRCISHYNVSKEGTCVPYCEAGECDDPQRICHFSVCKQRCDPTAPEETCEGEFVCGGVHYSTNEFLCTTAYFSKGGQLGDQCYADYACASGLGCVKSERLPDCEFTGCCSPFCSLVDIDPCAELGPGYACVPYFEPDQAPSGLEHVGLCEWL